MKRLYHALRVQLIWDCYIYPVFNPLKEPFIVLTDFVAVKLSGRKNSRLHQQGTGRRGEQFFKI